MALHPQAIAIVEVLIKEGQAGERPFGIPLATWKAAIAKKSS